MFILQYVYTWTSQLRLPSKYSLSQLSPVSPHILTPSHLRSFLLHLLSTRSLITHSTLSLFTFSHLFFLAPVHSYTFYLPPTLPAFLLPTPPLSISFISTNIKLQCTLNTLAHVFFFFITLIKLFSLTIISYIFLRICSPNSQ